MTNEKRPLVLELQDGPEYQPLLAGVPQTCGMRAGRVFLAPGQDCGEHSTGAHEETLVFLAGRGLARIEPHPALEVGAGKVCYIPPHTRHNIENHSLEPLIYIYCVAPVIP